MNWLANKQTRLKDKTLVTLTIEIMLDGDGEYFPWTDEGFKAAYKMYLNNIKDIRDNEDCWISIVADEGHEWSAPERITRKALSQKDWYKWHKFQSGEYNK
jgi:hypothetical protein